MKSGCLFPFNVHILPSSGSFGFSRGVSHKDTTVPQLQLRDPGCQNPKPSYHLDAFSCKIFDDFFSRGVFNSLILFGQGVQGGIGPRPKLRSWKTTLQVQEFLHMSPTSTKGQSCELGNIISLSGASVCSFERQKEQLCQKSLQLMRSLMCEFLTFIITKIIKHTHTHKHNDQIDTMLCKFRCKQYQYMNRQVATTFYI